MWEYPSICLFEFCFLLTSMHSVLWSERHWTNLFICKITFDVASVSLPSLSFHPTSSYSSLIWARNVGLDFQGSLLLKCEGTETQPESHHLVSLGGQEPTLTEGQGSKLRSWRGLEKKGLWASMRLGYGNWSLGYHFDCKLKGKKFSNVHKFGLKEGPESVMVWLASHSFK